MILVWIYSVIAGILSFFLLLPFWTTLVALLFGKEKLGKPKNDVAYDYGVIITAYKNVKIAQGLVKSLLAQKYDKLHIYLVADECNPEDWDFEHEKLTVFFPNPPLRLKAKSIIYAMENFVREHDYTAVFDADNLAHPEFFNVINRYAQHGHRAIQGQRTAKNLNTKFAKADALGEFYKNHVERYAPYLIGSSSVISGSGMAVETKLYWSYLMGKDIQAGKDQWKKMLQEDKILQNFLLRRNEKIVYALDAIVYDEKVTTGDQVETQRSRWLFSYFQNMPNALGIIRRGLLGLSFNQLFFGLMTISPPMFILLFGSLAFGLIGLFLVPAVAVSLLFSTVIFVLNIFLVLKLAKAPKEVWEVVWSLPAFVWKQLTGLFKMKDPNKNFKHTEHTVDVDIEEVLKKEK
ncbi:MAG TPA: glycosyltransferase [Saprospiraceae bacterium]|nr:glycosyltransferase [Saprospiraceae bacterium]